MKECTSELRGIDKNEKSCPDKSARQQTKPRQPQSIRLPFDPSAAKTFYA